jgi:hypothetical protein
MVIVSVHLFQREATDIGLYQNGIHFSPKYHEERHPEFVYLLGSVLRIAWI